MATEIEKLKREFLEYLEIEKGSSLKTVENYERYLNRFFNFAKIEKPVDVTDENVREFRLYLNRQSGMKMKGQGTTLMKKNTQNYYLIALRVFLKYLMKRGISIMSPDRIELAKIKERSLDLITEDELERLLSVPNGSDLKSLRDRAILELFFSTGLRVSELTSLNRDLDLSKSEFSIRGKGDKVRVVFLSDTAKKSIKEYLAKRPDMEEAMFIQVSKINKEETLRLTPRSIERIVKHYSSFFRHRPLAKRRRYQKCTDDVGALKHLHYSDIHTYY